MKNPLKIFKIAAVVLIVVLALQACGTSRSHCNTKGKTRVEMGFMWCSLGCNYSSKPHPTAPKGGLL